MFVITAQKKKYQSEEFETVYLAIDQNSGGYPYWSNYLGSAKIYNQVPNLVNEIAGCNYMLENVKSINTQRIDFTIVNEMSVEEQQNLINQYNEKLKSYIKA